jgi:hypothetical protein
VHLQIILWASVVAKSRTSKSVERDGPHDLAFDTGVILTIRRRLPIKATELDRRSTGGKREMRCLRVQRERDPKRCLNVFPSCPGKSQVNAFVNVTSLWQRHCRRNRLECCRRVCVAIVRHDRWLHRTGKGNLSQLLLGPPLEPPASMVAAQQACHGFGIVQRRVSVSSHVMTSSTGNWNGVNPPSAPIQGLGMASLGIAPANAVKSPERIRRILLHGLSLRSALS